VGVSHTLTQKLNEKVSCKNSVSFEVCFEGQPGVFELGSCCSSCSKHDDLELPEKEQDEEEPHVCSYCHTYVTVQQQR